jgi:hypothetical protein
VPQGGVANNAFLTRFLCFFDAPESAPSLVLRVVLFLSHLANMSSLAPSLLDLMSGRPSEKAMPKVTDPAFFGHQFKWYGHIYICRKTASKRGGTS